MRLFTAIILTVFFVLLSTTVMGQDYKKMREEVVQKQETLRTEIEELNEQINQYQNRLSMAEEKYDRLYEEFENLQRVIALQEEKIERLNEEQDHIEEEISVTEKEIEQNEQRLQELIENYRETLTYLYKHGRSSQLALLFSSSSINQMLVRSYYLEKFNTYRQQQEEQIKEQQAELKQNKEQLEQARKKNETVLAEIQSEYEDLEEKRAQQEENVRLLRQNKEQIAQDLRQTEQELDEINNALEKAIAEEQRIREAQEEELRRREEERKRKLAEAQEIEDEEERQREVEQYSTPITIEEEGYLDDERLEEIENTFAAEKGSLPWPVESTTISEHFGKRRHPVYGTFTPNPGIEIVTKSKEEVKVVHSGKVIDIRPFSGFGDVVMVQHGRFITAYGNLSEIFVRRNDIVNKGDTIGLSGDEQSVKGESLFFLVSENNTTLDPENWLSSK